MKKKILLALMVLLCWSSASFSSTIHECEVDSTFSFAFKLTDEVTIPAKNYDEFVFQIGNLADNCYQIPNSTSLTLFIFLENKTITL
ncbi:MAG: hypothetical protein LBU51_03670 [Bacteroidales bacterium]|jgi:hypothetical protein|nr:hypothetical protein [Bacteroidales bacterium]